jgi:hypothetical protein
VSGEGEELQTGARLRIVRRELYCKVQIDRDILMDRLTRPGADGRDVPEDVLESVRRLGRAGIQVVRALGVTEDLALDETSRWYGVNVPLDYGDQAVTALRAAELTGDTSLLERLTRRLKSTAAYRGVAEVGDAADGRRLDCPCHAQPPPPHTARGWHEDAGPGPVLSVRHAGSPGTRWHGELQLPRWVDHPYRLRREVDRWAYVAEPYVIDEAALSDLAFLVENGFEVTVTASRARHDPGISISIEITSS